MDSDCPITGLAVSAYTVPTDAPEADGTFAWDATTIVVVQVSAAGETGIGYTYADTAAAVLVQEGLAGVVAGQRALEIPRLWAAMERQVRNLGRPGIAAAAVSAVDNALWDLKARLLGCSLADLLGRARTVIDIYGSGGFTSYDDTQLSRQLAGWVEDGIPRVKMKVGTHPGDDVRRVAVARAAIGDGPQLFVDANGAYAVKQALALSQAFADLGVVWFEEPRPSDDLAGLNLLRRRLPPPIEVAAGEYGYSGLYFRRMLEAGAVDVLQADATRCGGVTGFLSAAALADAFAIPLSAHCAPSLHAHLCCVAPPARHIEYFHDHARIERMFFDGVLAPEHGRLQPDPHREGFGLCFKEADACPYRVLP